MCTGPELTAVAAIVSAGTGVAALQQAKKKSPALEPGKKPDAGITDNEKRTKLLAQLAAGAAKNNPSGGLAKAGGANVGSVLLGQ